MSLGNRGLGLITRAGDSYTTTNNNVVYVFSGIMDQEESIVTSAQGAVTVQSKTILTVQTTDANNINRQQVISRNGMNWIVDMKQLLGDGNLTKMTLKEQ